MGAKYEEVKGASENHNLLFDFCCKGRHYEENSTLAANHTAVAAMTQFIRAILDKNTSGAVYEGSIFDRDLILFHPESKLKFGVFDDFHPISTDLTEENLYEFILSPMVKRTSLSVISEAQGIETIHKWSGQIVAIDWKPQITQYQYVKSHLQSGEWVLVATSLGSLIFTSKAIEKELGHKVKVGEFLRWENLRIDLHAVV